MAPGGQIRAVRRPSGGGIQMPATSVPLFISPARPCPCLSLIHAPSSMEQSPRQQQLAPAPAGPPSCCSPVPPRLSEAPQRCVWRKRKAAEFDEVQLGSNKCSRVQLASTGRPQADQGSLAAIDFMNTSSRPVR